MSVDLSTRPGEAVLLTIQLASSSTGLYPQAVIYNINDLSTVYTTIDLDEIGNGAYAKKWTTPNSEAKYWVRMFVYTDSGHTSLSPIDRPAEQSINVSDSGGGGMHIVTGAKIGRAHV